MLLYALNLRNPLIPSTLEAEKNSAVSMLQWSDDSLQVPVYVREMLGDISALPPCIPFVGVVDRQDSKCSSACVGDPSELAQSFHFY